MIETPRRRRARQPRTVHPAIEAGTGDPALPAPPDLGDPAHQASRAMHSAFRRLNPLIMVPLLRSGLGAWLGNPLGGWLLVIRVRGRKTGLDHDIPLSYRIDDGCAWVLAGFGPRTQWYRNILVNPGVELLLPGRPPIRAIGEEVLDRSVRARIVPSLVRATGIPGYLAGADPFRGTDERILEATAWVPLIRLWPQGEPLIQGPDDPGGHGWIWRQAVFLALTVWAVRQTGRLRRPR